MARPRKNLFYESPKGIQPLSGQEWLETYDSNCQKVVDYLVLNGVGNTIYYSTVNCLEKLRIFLLQNNTPYSFRQANQWFETTEPHPKGYQTALSRLQDIFEYGKIQPINAFPVSLPYYSCCKCLKRWRSAFPCNSCYTDENHITKGVKPEWEMENRNQPLHSQRYPVL